MIEVLKTDVDNYFIDAKEIVIAVLKRDEFAEKRDMMC